MLGFQLAIVLTETFDKLPTLPRMLHATALLSVALSVALFITPSALHRIVWAGENTQALLRHGATVWSVKRFVEARQAVFGRVWPITPARHEAGTVLAAVKAASRRCAVAFGQP